VIKKRKGEKQRKGGEREREREEGRLLMFLWTVVY
jgi:hypothetical protein